MKRLLLCIIFLCLAAAGVGFFGGLVAAAQENVPRMTKEELKPLIGDPNVMVIDVRTQVDWDNDTLMIKGAVREDPMKVPSWIDDFPKEKSLVFYCS